MGHGDLVARTAVVVVLPTGGKIVLFLTGEIGGGHRDFDHAPICRHVLHFDLPKQASRPEMNNKTHIPEHRCPD
jgi:hypothetical protein